MRSKVVKWSMASASAGELGVARRIQRIQSREGTGLEARFVCHGKVDTHGKAMELPSQTNIVLHLCYRVPTQMTWKCFSCSY